MSTSDDTPGRTDETARADESGPAAPPVAEPVPAPPATEPAVDTGKHAVVRPAPVPPPPARPDATAPQTPVPATTDTTAVPAAAPDPVVAATPARAEAPVRRPVAAATAPATASPTPTPTAEQTAVHPAPEPVETDPRPDQKPELFPAPNAPRTTTWGTHVLGALVGLLLAPLAAGVLLLGQSRILAEQAPGWDASLDVTGIVLVGLGLLALGWVAILAVWTPAAPITGGLVVGVIGGFALIAPGIARSQTLRVVDSDGWRTTVTQVTVAGTSGTLIVAGFLVLIAGLVAVLAHRRGVRLGAFRERHR